jgi:acetyl/propionyl-CoA carboxylase alpha subunit
MWLPGGPNVRVDTYVYTGCQVPGDYDPSIAKLSVWGADRQGCIERMRCALDEFSIAGIETNLSLLQTILSHPNLARAGIRQISRLIPARMKPDPQTIICAIWRSPRQLSISFVSSVSNHRSPSSQARTCGGGACGSLLHGATCMSPMRKTEVTLNGRVFEVEIDPGAHCSTTLRVHVNGEAVQVLVSNLDGQVDGLHWLAVDGRPYELKVDQNLHWIQDACGLYELQIRETGSRNSGHSGKPGPVKAPIPGDVWLLVFAGIVRLPIAAGPGDEDAE